VTLYKGSDFALFGNNQNPSGQIKEARELYMQSLALSESNGNVQGKAATLQCLGYLKPFRGKSRKRLPFMSNLWHLLKA
jgi:hypothetical protein